VKPKTTRGKPLPERKSRKPLPGWIGLVAVVATAFATGWGMLKTARGRGWTAGPDSSYLPVEAARIASPSIAAVEPGGLAVAGAPVPVNPAAAPAIAAGTAPRHEDRGTCTSCHAVLAATGQPVPSISALAPMSHEYRGMCTNCHGVVVGNAAATQPSPQAAQQVGWPQCPAGAMGLPPQGPGAGRGLGPVRQF
jgi:hypothetical protein